MTLHIIGRDGWDAAHEDGAGPAPVPAREWWLHHSVTLAPDLEFLDVDRDGVDDDERRAMQTLERIGEQRFGRGVSYTWVIPPSGRVYAGHGMGRLGAHTAGHNTRGRAICFLGNYDVHDPTDAQLTAAAELMVVEHRAGRALTHRFNGGHRDLKSTACPGRHAYAAIGEINRRAAALWADGSTPSTRPDISISTEQQEDLVQNHFVTGQGGFRVICPTGAASGNRRRSFVSAAVNGPRKGWLRVFAQSDTGGITDWAWDIGFAEGRSARPWRELPDGTTQLAIQHDVPDGAVVCIETLPAA